MKITSIPASSGGAQSNVDVGHSAGAERMARAIAVASGQTPETAQQVDPQVERAQESIKRIKMRTNRNTSQPIEAPVAETAETESDIPATSEQTQVEPEATQQLSPQYAALAKAKRALQAKEREIAVREAALAAKPSDTMSGGYTKDQIKANALGILREAGVTNDDLTQAILQEAGDYGPGYSKLEAEMKALRESMDNQSKALSERDQAMEAQVLTQIRHDVDQLISQGDEYETVREAGYAPKVVKLMHEVFKKEGKLLDITEAAQIIEDELLNEAVRYARLKKVQGRLAPAPVEEQQQAVQQERPNTKIMRTLTNRDGGSSISMSRRERAIAAAEGRLK